MFFSVGSHRQPNILFIVTALPPVPVWSAKLALSITPEMRRGAKSHRDNSCSCFCSNFVRPELCAFTLRTSETPRWRAVPGR
ncbi:MAG: hypothetical protein WA615_22910 [Bradyrhizobium sp.]